MYAILRGDLQMSVGKASSQLGHAFKILTKNILENNPILARQYFDDGIGTNICLKSKNLNALQRAHHEAMAADIPCALITDQDHILLPYFTGRPIITALGIGPCTRSEIEHITKRFNCIT